MKLNELRDNDGARKERIRVGRGIGSGKGKTGGRGQKGQKSRSGVTINGYEGGQMPLYRRLPKRGFKNPFRIDYAEINVGALQDAIDAKRLDAGQPIHKDSLAASGPIRAGKPLRLLGHGELKTKLSITAAGATKSAIAAVEKAGGSVTLAPVKAPKPEKDKPAD